MRCHAAALLVPLLLLTGCGSEGDDPEPDASTTSASATTDLPTVTGAFGEQPVVELPAGDPGDELVVEVLEAGDGDVLAEGDVLVADYLGQVWTDAAAAGSSDDPSADTSADPAAPAAGAVFDSTFDGGTPVSLTLSAEGLLPGMLEGLLGQSVGSRVLVVIPPDKGFGEQGQPELGIGAGDSLVFVFDLVEAFGPDAAADGTEVALTQDPALPVVVAGEDGPTITVPSASPPPTELVVQTLIEGAGDEVLAGQHMVVQYRGVLWRDGSEFDSSWSRLTPTGFPIGVGGVIAGWDTGLVGQTVGSQVLLVVPPAEGYGAEGSPPTIAGDDTLVFVVDILGAYGDGA